VTGALAVARRVVAVELAQYRSLVRWLARRPDVPAGAMAFGYAGAVAPLLWTFVFLSALELVALHLLLPWETVRIVVDVLSAWGLVWMLGLTASFSVRPHLVGDSGLRVRNGAGTDITVPWEAVAAVAARQRNRGGSRAVQLDRDEKSTVLNVVVGSQTNVDVTLRRPLAVPLPRGAEPVTGLRLFADDARGLVHRAREHLADRQGASPARDPATD
jgi:hypothetical protein